MLHILQDWEYEERYSIEHYEYDQIMKEQQTSFVNYLYENNYFRINIYPK